MSQSVFRCSGEIRIIFPDLKTSLIVSDFTISVYDSSCNSLFFGLIYWPPKAGRDNKQYMEKENMKKCVQTRELHELPYTEMVKYGDYLTRLWNCIYKLHENYIITKVTKHSGIASGSPTLHCFIKFANITSHQGNKPKKMLILLLITGTCPLP